MKITVKTSDDRDTLTLQFEEENTRPGHFVLDGASAEQLAHEISGHSDLHCFGRCSVVADDLYSNAKYIPPSPPTPVAQVKRLQKPIWDEKLVAPVQISDVRSASNGGPPGPT